MLLSECLSELQSHAEHGEMEYSSGEESDTAPLATPPDLRDMCLKALGSLSSASSHQLRELVCKCIRKKHLTKQWIRALSTASSAFCLAVELNFSGTEISFDGLSLAAEIPSLHTLSLEGCRNVTDDALALFRGQNIARLNVSRCPRLTAEVADHIASFANSLTYLDFADNDVSPSAIASMVDRLPLLECLNVARTRVSQPFLASASKACEKLRVLDLTSCSIAAEALVHLGSFPALSVIDLSNTQFSKQGVQSLKRLLLSRSEICSVTVKPPLRIEAFNINDVSSKLSMLTSRDCNLLCDAETLANAILDATCGRTCTSPCGTQQRIRWKLQVSTSPAASSSATLPWPTDVHANSSSSADQLIAACLSIPSPSDSQVKQDSASSMSSPMSFETRSTHDHPYRYHRSVRTGDLFVAPPRAHPQSKKRFQTIERATQSSEGASRKRKCATQEVEDGSSHARKRQRSLPESGECGTKSLGSISLSRQYQQIEKLAPRRLCTKALRNHIDLSTLHMDSSPRGGGPQSSTTATTTTLRVKTASSVCDSSARARSQGHDGSRGHEMEESRKPSLSRQFRLAERHPTEAKRKDRMLRKRRCTSISSMG